MTSIGERVTRSLNRATVIQRVCQGQMSTVIDDVDEAALNYGLLSLITDIVEDLQVGNVRGIGPNARGSVRVLLQDLDDPLRLELRDPRAEVTDLDRERLRAKLPPAAPRPS